jgi:hypothetical protein
MRRRRNNFFRRYIRSNNNYKRRQNNKDKEQNKKINQLQKEIKVLKLTTEKQMGNSKTDFLVPYQKSYDFENYKNAVTQYINAMLYPERYLNIGIKLPSPMNTYSFTYGFKEQFDFTPAKSGIFNMIWYPNFFSSVQVNVGNLAIPGSTSVKIGQNRRYFYGTKRFLICNNDNNVNEWWAPGNHQMLSPTEGYRLVSASINIRYVGNNINKAGYIMSIPTYRDIPAFATENTDTMPTFTTTTIPTIDESVFVNTRGTKSNFTLAPNNVVKRIYVPIDPADQIFEDPGYYYSSAIDSNQGSKYFSTIADGVNEGVLIEANNNILVRVLKPEDGNPLKYVFLGKGLVDVSGSIHVEAYYNFECIPVEGMRNTANPQGNSGDALNNEEKNIIIDEVAKEEMSDNNVRGRTRRIINNFKNRSTRFARNAWNRAKPFIRKGARIAFKAGVNALVNNRRRNPKVDL